MEKSLEARSDMNQFEEYIEEFYKNIQYNHLHALIFIEEENFSKVDF